MKLQTVWNKTVVVIYLVVVAGVCLYVPSYWGFGAEMREFSYRWVWNLNTGLVVFGYSNGALVAYGRVALEVVSLTAIAGALLIIGSFVEGRKRGKQSDPSTP